MKLKMVHSGDSPPCEKCDKKHRSHRVAFMKRGAQSAQPPLANEANGWQQLDPSGDGTHCDCDSQANKRDSKAGLDALCSDSHESEQFSATLRRIQPVEAKNLAIAMHIIEKRFPWYCEQTVEKVMRWVSLPGMLSLWDRGLRSSGLPATLWLKPRKTQRTGTESVEAGV